MVSRISTSHASSPKATDSRGQAVLSAIIKEHLVTGEPVGSRTISDRFAHASGWSAATIRNVMGQLEDAGLVEQPHTSAGRVPTDKGYRFYVDHILGQARLSKSDLAAINSFLKNLQTTEGGSPDRLLEKVSHALSTLSENVGIVVSPSLADNRLQHIEFLQLADNRILVVLVSAPNIVHNKIIRIDEALTQDELEQTARYLNIEFGGKSLFAIRAEIVEMMREEKALYDKLLRNAILLCDRSLEGDEATTAEVYVDGASNMLTKPDFADTARMRELFRTFEEKSRLVKILNECVSRDQSLTGHVQVVIGREHAAPSMQDCALITAPYWIGDDIKGTLGVVGPMRIEYERMMAVVNYMARHVEQLLREERSAV
ncbi:MAG TPA: heat-inducible transcriptional repressor HrcA [Pyrinomonadaceae bacterium]|nr:heat-inducible transcriptional repressor HrcA [Pyrinomonadaceae bacterium]